MNYIVVTIIIILSILIFMGFIFFIRFLYLKFFKKPVDNTTTKKKVTNINLNIGKLNKKIQNNEKSSTSRILLNIDMKKKKLNNQMKTSVKRIKNNDKNNNSELSIEEYKIEKLKIDFNETINISLDKEKTINTRELDETIYSSMNNTQVFNFKINEYDPNN